jgi:CRP-like cAMP-binding protein
MRLVRNNELVEFELRAIMKTTSVFNQHDIKAAPQLGINRISPATSCIPPVTRIQPRLRVVSKSSTNTRSDAHTYLARAVVFPLTDVYTPIPRFDTVKRKMPVVNSPSQNRLLSSLPTAELKRLLPDLELVEMQLGDVLYESGGRMQYVFFPTTSIVSLFYVLEDGASTEIAAVGNEGILGISIFMGGDTTPSRAVVQSAGFGYRLKVQSLKLEFERVGPLFRLLLRYTQALMTQMTQMAVCNRHHSLEQQLCRRLLFSLDRLPNDSLIMTQELIANMLGVRREGVTAAAGNLQRAGLIRYSRGRIDILDRSGLEDAVCECYAVVKLEFNRLLSDNCQSDPFHALREPENEVEPDAIGAYAKQISVERKKPGVSYFAHGGE